MCFDSDMHGSCKESLTSFIKTVIGFRMPYDLPLVKYGPNDEPWCATKAYAEPDWMGRSWRS
jgi:tyrosyl-DNA phosphodiesterase-1